MSRAGPGPWDLTDALDLLITGRGIQASNDHLFRGALFGRDSLQVAIDLAPWYPALAERILINLASYQGVATAALTEEEPGRIHHEARSRFDGPLQADESVRHVMDELARGWGIESGDELVYYGSVDATCLFVRAVAELVRHHPNRVQILDRGLRHRTGTETTLRQAVRRAVSWIETRLRDSRIGLLEYRRSNPQGITNQVLRDGASAYFHENGSSINLDGPVASIEVQGLAWAALLAADNLLDDSSSSERQALAHHVRDNTMRLLWLDAEQRFATAVDRDASGNPRPVRIATTLPAELLECGFFAGLPDGPALVKAAAQPVFDPEFLTGVGARSTAKRYAPLFEYWTYHGSATVWFVTNNIVARGLRHYGLLESARELERRILAGIARAGYVEFLYVDPHDGAIAFELDDRPTPNARRIAATNRPESPQAWTVSAAIRATRAADRPAARRSWQRRLDRSLCADIGTDSPPASLFWLDTDAGRRKERSLLASW